MIFSQSILMYLLSLVASFFLSIRLTTYLHNYFPLKFAVLVTTTIILHPLSIDAFLGPNPLSGPIAFWLLLEGLFCLRQMETKRALLFMLFASICNIAYSLFPIFYFFQFDKKRKHIPFALVYTFLLFFYYWKLLHPTLHDPIIFISNLLHFLLLPISPSIFTPGLFPFSLQTSISALAIIALYFWSQRKNSSSRLFLPLFFLPAIGDLFHQWSAPYQFWSDVFLNGSNYLCITFAFVTILAIHLPKKYFATYFFLTIFLSFNWAVQWKPKSNVIRQSVSSLPEGYKNQITPKRMLAWQLIQEGNTSEGINYLKDMVQEFPDNQDLKNDLMIFKKE